MFKLPGLLINIYEMSASIEEFFTGKDRSTRPILDDETFVEIGHISPNNPRYVTERWNLNDFRQSSNYYFFYWYCYVGNENFGECTSIPVRSIDNFENLKQQVFTYLTNRVQELFNPEIYDEVAHGYIRPDKYKLVFKYAE